MPLLRAKAAAKTTIRNVVRRTGYDLTPFSTGFSEVQTRLLRQVDLLVDVGANTGQYAERMRQLGYTGRMLSFEPGAESFEVLQRHLAPPVWEARKVALGAEEGTATLRISRNRMSSSFLPIREEHVAATPAAAYVAEEAVPVSTLDRQLEAVDGERLWLKMDVQGTEIDVVAGAKATLERTAVVQSELSLRPLYEGQTDYLELCRLLRDVGLHLIHIEEGLQEPGTGHLLQIDALFARD